MKRLLCLFIIVILAIGTSCIKNDTVQELDNVSSAQSGSQADVQDNQSSSEHSNKLVENIIFRMTTAENAVISDIYSEELQELQQLHGDFPYTIHYLFYDLNQDGTDEIISYIASALHSAGGAYYLDVWSINDSTDYVKIADIYFFGGGFGPSELAVMEDTVNGYHVIVSSYFNANGTEEYTHRYCYDDVLYEQQTTVLEKKSAMRAYYDQYRRAEEVLSSDLSLPPIERQWEHMPIEVIEPDRYLTDNEWLWIVRDPEHGLEKAKDIILGEITWANEYNYFPTINFTSDWGIDYQYLINLCGTLTFNKRKSSSSYRIMLNGEPMRGISLTQDGTFNFMYYESISGVGYYTAPEIRDLQEAIPYALQEKQKMRFAAEYFYDYDGEAVTDDALDAFFSLLEDTGDSVKDEISAFINDALSGEHRIIDYRMMHFDDPADIPNELMVLSGIEHTNYTSAYYKIDEVPTEPEQIISVLCHEVYNRNSGGVPAVLVEKTAQYYFGDTIHIEHKGYGPKRYSYYDWAQVYIHAPMGTGGEFMFFPVLDYQDIENGYKAEIALIYGFSGMTGPFLFDKDETGNISIEWNNAAEYARTQAERVEITIIRHDGHFQIQSFCYIGYPKQ